MATISMPRWRGSLTPQQSKFDFELDDPDSMAPLDDAPYRNITRLLRLAMQACCQLEEPAKEQAEAFIAPYLSGDLNAMEIPPAAGTSPR